MEMISGIHHHVAIGTEKCGFSIKIFTKIYSSPGGWSSRLEVPRRACHCLGVPFPANCEVIGVSS